MRRWFPQHPKISISSIIQDATLRTVAVGVQCMENNNKKKNSKQINTETKPHLQIHSCALGHIEGKLRSQSC